VRQSTQSNYKTYIDDLRDALALFLLLEAPCEVAQQAAWVRMMLLATSPERAALVQSLAAVQPVVLVHTLP
jgi:hypothetical protein